MAIARLVEKMGVKDDKTITALNEFYKDNTEDLEKILRFCYEKKTSFQSSKEDQENLLAKLIKKGQVLPVQLMLQGPHFKLNLLDDLRIDYMMKPPLFLALRFKHLDLVRFFLSFFKDLYENKKMCGTTKITTPENYLHFSLDNYQDCLGELHTMRILSSSDRTSDKLSDKDQESLRKLIADYLNLIPQEYIHANPFVDGTFTFYENIIYDEPELALALFTKYNTPHEKLAETNSLHLAIVHQRDQVYDALVHRLSPKACNKTREADGCTPLQIAVHHAGTAPNPERFVDPLLAKLDAKQAQVLTEDKRHNILHLSLNGSYYRDGRNQKGVLLNFIKLLLKIQNPDMIDDEVVRLATKHSHHAAIITRLFKKGYDLQALILSVVNKEIARLREKNALTLFGRSTKLQHFEDLEKIIRNPIDFYRLFFADADNITYEEKMTDTEVISVAMTGILKVVPSYCHYNLLKDTTWEDPHNKHSIGSIFKISRWALSISKADSTVHFEEAINELLKSQPGSKRFTL